MLTETAGRSLEGKHPEYFIIILILIFLPDMDVIFALAYNEGISPVEVSLRKDIPRAGSVEANKILGLNSEGPSE